MRKTRWKTVFFIFLLSWPILCLFARSDFGRDALCGAAYGGDLIGIRLLVAAGADPSRVGWEEHFTPLAETVRGGQVEAARLLLQLGADPNRPNDNGWGTSAAETTASGDGEPEQCKAIVTLLNAARKQ